MQSLFKQYPAGNDPKSAADGGLNFSVLRFNAPQKLDNRAYVGRMDYNLDSAGRHTLMLRGTLAGNAQDSSTALAQFPGQQAASKTSRQFARPRGPLHRGDLAAPGQRPELWLHAARHRLHRQYIP